MVYKKKKLETNFVVLLKPKKFARCTAWKDNHPQIYFVVEVNPPKFLDTKLSFAKKLPIH